MKKSWLIALAGAVLLAGCSANDGKLAHQKSSEVAVSTKQAIKSTKTTKASKQAKSDKIKQSLNQTGKTKKITTTLWNSAKEKQLSAFMKTWQTQMGQTYEGTYDGQNPDHLGFVFPKAITSGIESSCQLGASTD